MFVFKKKYILSCLIIICAVFFIGYVKTLASTAQLNLEITGLGIRHGTPENFPIGMVMSSPTDQVVSGQFTEYFRVEDIEGYATGHYTTIQCDGIYGPSSTRLTGIELMAGSTDPELIMGMTGPNVTINPDLASYQNIIEPITYIYKESNTNHMGIVNKYGDKPWIKILIPSGTPGGTYSGTIVFSFYME